MADNDGDSGRVSHADSAQIEVLPSARVAASSFSGEALALPGLAGSYRQVPLDGSLRLEAGKDGALMLRVGGAPAQGPLQALAADLHVGPGVLLRVERDAKGQVEALVYGNERVRRLRHTRD